MANPAAITEGSAGLKLPLLVGPDGTRYIPAAGDGEAMSGGFDNQRAPALVQISSPMRGTLTNRSGAIASGGTAQQLAPTNGARKYLFIANTDDTGTGEPLWINFTTTAVEAQPSIKLMPGDAFVMEGFFISTELVSVRAATTGHTWTAKEG